MKRLLLLLALPLCALAQPNANSIRLSCPSCALVQGTLTLQGSAGLVLSNAAPLIDAIGAGTFTIRSAAGQGISLDSAGAGTATVTIAGTNATQLTLGGAGLTGASGPLTLTTNLADSATQTAVILNNTTALPVNNGSIKMLSIQHGGSEKAYIRADGSFFSPGITSTTNLFSVRGVSNDGASSVGVTIANSNALSTTGAKALRVFSDNSSTEQFSIIKESNAWYSKMLSGGFETAGTATPAFQCTGAGACDVRSASGQNITLDSLGGTSSVLVGTGSATTTTVGRSGQTTNINGTVTFGSVFADWTFGAFDPLSGVQTTGNINSMGPTKIASTVQDVTYVQGVAGTGGTTQTLKLCDTSGCGSGVIYATCTPTCTSTAGTVVACTINTSAMAAAKTLFWAITSTTCTTDSSGNVTAHMSTP